MINHMQQYYNYTYTCSPFTRVSVHTHTIHVLAWYVSKEKKWEKNWYTVLYIVHECAVYRQRKTCIPQDQSQQIWLYMIIDIAVSEVPLCNRFCILTCMHVYFQIVSITELSITELFIFYWYTQVYNGQNSIWCVFFCQVKQMYFSAQIDWQVALGNIAPHINCQWWSVPVSSLHACQ